MSISSTGLYGSATIVNTDIFDDVQTLKEEMVTLSTSYLQTTQEHREDISQNRLDISSNLSKINDLSDNRIVSIEQDITDISNNRIVSIEQDITDLSNNRIVDIEQDITDLSNNRITDIEQDITDISSNKAFIRTLQSVDYSILLANAPAQWPTPPIQSGYNGVFCTDAGIDIIAQNFLDSKIGTPSVLSFQSGDTSDNTINII